MTNRILTSVILLVVTASLARAQDKILTEMWERPYGLSIQDNSFFLEEAFNQEDRVIQHISTLTYFQKPLRSLGYTFTQEWPVGGAAHQLSFDLTYGSLGPNTGLGDLSINYRYQLLDKPDGIALAPRLSVILPTGDEKKGFGLGSVGAEIGIPASKRLSEAIVAHANLGVTLFPNVKVPTITGAAVHRVITAYSAGASLIWLAHPNVNLMLEGVSVFASEPDEYANMTFTSVHILSPGVRFAVNLDDLQIVPGIAVPVRLHDGVSETGVFGYLSFEHGI
jgi:hypothetical protein